MPIHPRSLACIAARDHLVARVRDVAELHDLTAVELTAILLDLARTSLTLQLQRERHPLRPDTPADLT